VRRQTGCRAPRASLGASNAPVSCQHDPPSDIIYNIPPLQHCDQRKYAPRKPETKCPSVFVSEVTAQPCRGGRGLTPRCDTREEWSPTNQQTCSMSRTIKEYMVLDFISPYLETHENPTRSHVARERDQIPRWLAFCSLLLHHTAGGCIQADSLFAFGGVTILLLATLAHLVITASENHPRSTFLTRSVQLDLIAGKGLLSTLILITFL
jgi:hypothetical protein